MKALERTCLLAKALGECRCPPQKLRLPPLTKVRRYGKRSLRSTGEGSNRQDLGP